MDNKSRFSLINRQETLKSLKSTEFDLIIIGGGITGAGIALDAVSRGLKVLLIEMQDFAAGTSSRSSKLIHGGLRYLENLEFGLVKKYARERKIVYQNAPHLVRPLKFLLPITPEGKLNKLTLSLALRMYDYLAGVKPHERKQSFNRDELIQYEPSLINSKINRGAVYYEYKTSDSRLTIEILKKAHDLGAVILNYCEATSFNYRNNKIIGCQLKDLIYNETFNVKSKLTVNASGVWVDIVRRLDYSLGKTKLHITKGIHIVISKKRLQLKNAIYFDTADKRMILAIPSNNVVYIGTTDIDYSNNYTNPNVSEKEIQYLLDSMNRLFPQHHLIKSDIISSWAGLRPLIHKEGKKPSELSRKDEIFYSRSGLISIAGGKLSGYRLMAKKIVDIVCKRLYNSNKYPKCKTDSLKLSGGEFPFDSFENSVLEYADSKYDEAKQIKISIDNFKILFYRYGSNIELITNQAYEYYRQTKNYQIAWIRAEVWYSINFEMTTKLLDFFLRRTELLYFQPDNAVEILDIVITQFKSSLNWPDTKVIEEKEKFHKSYTMHTNFNNK